MTHPDSAPSQDRMGGTHQPIFNIPPILLWFLVVLVGIHLLRTYTLSPEADTWLLLQTGFIPWQFGAGFSWADPAGLWSGLTSSFLHGGSQHLIFNCLWMVVFGTPVARRIGPVRFCLFWLFSAYASAFFILLFHWQEEVLLLGASGAISALTAAACRFAWTSRRTNDNYGPLMTIRQALTTRSGIIFIAVWALGNVVLAAFPAILTSGSSPVDWEAHLGGFVFGFFAFPLFDRKRY